MDQNIPKSDNSGDVRDSTRQVLACFSELAQGFADNLKFSLDSRMDDFVVRVRMRIQASDKFLDRGGSL